MAFRAAHAPACTAEAEALLGCLPDWLSPACQIGYPSNDPEGCGPVINDLEGCADDALDSCSGAGASLVGATACKGQATCAAGDAEITCTPNGTCTCFLDGDVVGTCAMPFTGTEPCLVTVTCCRPFFAP